MTVMVIIEICSLTVNVFIPCYNCLAVSPSFSLWPTRKRSVFLPQFSIFPTPLTFYLFRSLSPLSLPLLLPLPPSLSIYLSSSSSFTHTISFSDSPSFDSFSFFTFFTLSLYLFLFLFSILLFFSLSIFSILISIYIYLPPSHTIVLARLSLSQVLGLCYSHTVRYLPLPLFNRI